MPQKMVSVVSAAPNRRPWHLRQHRLRYSLDHTLSSSSSSSLPLFKLLRATITNTNNNNENRVVEVELSSGWSPNQNKIVGHMPHH